ncbi:hypothetical protein [Actinoallomurus purpureus]|uniref:hypothetical protein n=1 Tax=Actinoallomurus purpureus TaxID=478114 RepID=UPI0027E347F6|nr:hypothetical protein [Actinoallomurus purpureus]
MGIPFLQKGEEVNSNLFPWLVQDLDVRTVPLEKVADAVDGRTALVAFSVVQSATGEIALADRFLAGLGLPPTGSAIVSVDVPGAAERLAAAGVRAAVRDGRLRAAFHLYTTDADVDLALNALT